MNETSAAAAANAKTRHWLLFLTGVLLFLAGPVLNVVQLSLKQLWMPWYLPLLASVGVLLMFVSVWRRRGVVRIVGLVVFALLCGFEWFVFLVAAKVPSYSGPAQPGEILPAFATTLADGATFTDDDLKQGRPTVLVFNRGRW